MKKMVLLMALVAFTTSSYAQYFNDDIKRLYASAVENNDTLKFYKTRQDIAGVDIQTAKFSYLPRIAFGASYTRLNDDIVFPDNLQQLLMGTQKLLIKELKGVPFNTPLPASVPLKPVPPVQQKDIFKTNVTGQWLLFSGMKVFNGIKAYEHQQKALQYLSAKQSSKLWLDVSDAYDKLALLYASDAIINSSEQVLERQTKFVNAAINNGLATPLDRKKIELAQQKLEIKKLENRMNKKVLVDKLHQITGMPVEEIKQMQPQLVPAVFDVNSIPAERAEIKALNEGIAAKKYAEKAALSDYVPKVVAFGQYELRDKDLSMFDPKWAVGVKLQWNLFDGLTARNNARKEAMERQGLEIQKKAAQDMIALGYSKLTSDYELASDKVMLKSKEVKLAEDTYDFVQKQYINGLNTITELLNALSDVEKARFELRQAEYEQRRAALQAAELSGMIR